MAAIVDIGTFIERRPGLRGGRPVISGTGLCVRTIACCYAFHGLTPEQIADNYPHVSLAQVYAALSYYLANRQEIDDDLAAEAALEEQLASQA
ncbi:MAG: DUF433 domain-containing protein [Acidobacteria bacterium]|nr:DUF433 domain-containing protein [Acidobacteriota bacterium]